MLNAILVYLGEHPDALVAALVSLVVYLKGKPWVDQVRADKRAGTIAKLAHIAFGAVEEASHIVDMNAAAKVALFLDKLTKAAEAAELGPLAPEEKALAQQVADALHVETRSSPPPPLVAP